MKGLLLRMVLGTDMMLTLDQWYCADEIFRLCYPVYMRREKDAILDQRIIQKIAEYQEKYGKVVRRIVEDPIEISSSLIRQKLLNGESVDTLIPASVEKYITANHLYV